MLVLALWSCELFVRLMEKRTRRREVAYVLVTSALMYTHLYGVFAILAQHVAFPLDARRAFPPLRWLLLNVAVAALFGPWIPTTLQWTRFVNSAFWTPPMTPAHIADIYHLYAGSW